MKIKKIVINELSDKVLKDLSKFSILNCDKVIVEINKNINVQDINNKILELNKIRFDWIELLSKEDLWDDINNRQEIPDKYINEWNGAEFNEDGGLSISMDFESINKILKFLININTEYSVEDPNDFKIYWEDSIEDFISDDYYSWFWYKNYLRSRCGSPSTLNPKYEVEFVYI